MQRIDARGIANYLLDKAEASSRPLDQLQLQKLVYLSHGWHLGLSGRPLIVQDVVAWPYGPVIRDVYHAFKHFRGEPVTGRASYLDRLSGQHQCFGSPTDPYARAVVDAVWSQYGRLSGNQLVTLTHEKGAPWETVTSGMSPESIRDIPIPDEIIRRYYHELALKNEAARVQRKS